MDKSDQPTWLDLYDYRRRVAALGRQRARALRAGMDAAAVWQRFCAQKDALYARHPQSPLPAGQRAGFGGLRYFPYDPALCCDAQLIAEPATPAESSVPAPAYAVPLQRAARLAFTLAGRPQELIVYWIDVYGGGLFLPFRDATSGRETYGGGRYLFDTVKGSDLLPVPADGSLLADDFGVSGSRVRLDFNYAYNPSCAYDARWACPLAPPENRLTLPIRAGEQHFLDESRQLPSSA